MSSLTLLLLVDAFRPDYLRDAPYIRGLAQRGATGRLREPFGFVPRAAYFGGLTPEQSGATHMYWFDPERSPFDAAMNLPLGLGTDEQRRSMRRLLDDRARTRVPAFARHYVSCLNIPRACLPFLAVAEEYAPWESRVGFRVPLGDGEPPRLQATPLGGMRYDGGPCGTTVGRPIRYMRCTVISSSARSIASRCSGAKSDRRCESRFSKSVRGRT